jgi:hypothetical protein
MRRLKVIKGKTLDELQENVDKFLSSPFVCDILDIHYVPVIEANSRLTGQPEMAMGAFILHTEAEQMMPIGEHVDNPDCIPAGNNVLNLTGENNG